MSVCHVARPVAKSRLDSPHDPHAVSSRNHRVLAARRCAHRRWIGIEGADRHVDEQQRAPPLRVANGGSLKNSLVATPMAPPRSPKRSELVSSAQQRGRLVSHVVLDDRGQLAVRTRRLDRERVQRRASADHLITIALTIGRSERNRLTVLMHGERAPAVKRRPGEGCRRSGDGDTVRRLLLSPYRRTCPSPRPRIPRPRRPRAT